jgi:cytoskeletal protein CcmA (bactofilin family)
MFKSKNEPVTVKQSEPVVNSFTSNTNTNTNTMDSIAEGTVFTGNITASKGIKINGVIKGSVTCNGKVIVGKSGIIEGEIKCLNAEIEGVLKSAITVKELLELKSTANLQGEIITGRLSVEPGASFTGSCKMGGVVKDIKEETTVGQIKEKTA